MAEAPRLAAALRYQQELDDPTRPATVNPMMARQVAKSRELMTAPTSIMDERYPAWKKAQENADLFLLGADAAGLSPFAAKGATVAAKFAAPKLAQGLEQHMIRSGMMLHAAPQDEALRLAQQRAALPVEQGGLGLSPSNTAAERAAAMGGKEAIHFSRTGGDFNVLDSGQYAVAPFDAIGTHVGTKEAALDRFRNTVGTIDTPRGSTYPVQVLGDRPLMNEKGLPWGEDELNAYLRKTGGHNWSDVNGGKMIYQDMNKDLRKKLFEDQGYTSIPYINDVEAKGAVSYIVPPDNLRSRFAAFDPFRRNAATAAAMGVAAPDLLAKERK